jgi:hypothetical protein
MTDDYRLNDISLNEALAILLGKSLWRIRHENYDFLSELEKSLADAVYALEAAQESGDPDKIHACEQAVDQADRAYENAGELYTKLAGEIAKARKLKPTLIWIVLDDNERSYDTVRISRQSLLDWASEAKIKIVGIAPPPPTRTHTTPLLALLDELIQEFWEGYDEDKPPKNEAIKKFVEITYGDWKKTANSGPSHCTVTGASDTVIDAMCTMMRPPEVKRNG